ncbi:peptidoglycan-binding protein [Patescibacteria group bacterium]|nr:MAG: peptidoglycan-binding protein [Patescibacteria group bacterium]
MNSSIKKFVAGFAGVAIALSLVLGAAAPAQAATVAELQAMIAQLQAQLSASATATPVSYTFARNLTVGSTGADVKNLQILLNSNAATRVALSGAGSPGKETSTFGPATKAAVIKYQRLNSIPTTGYVGPLTRAALALASTPSTPVVTVPGGTVPPVVVPSGSGLRVMLAADSANTALVAGQAIGELGKFTFVNPTAAPITITNLAFMRTGASSDSTLSNIYLYQGANRLTDAAGLSNSNFNFNSSAGLVTVPAGSSVSVSVRADIAAGTSGQLVGVQLKSVGANGPVDGGVVFPISSYQQTISSASIGTAAFTYTGPTGASDNPTNDIRVFEASVVISTHAARLESIAFENRGSSSDADFRNLRLYVDGVQVGNTVAALVNDRATFDLSANPLRLETGTRIVKVLADVIGGSGETYDIQIRRTADVRVVDVELGQPILATDAGGSFPVSAASANNISAASLSVVRAPNSPSTDISVGATNVKLASFEFRASGENVKIETITVDADSSLQTTGGFDNGKVFLNGVQVGSTLDISSSGTDFDFGSSFILQQGQVAVVDIYADAKTSTSTNYADSTTLDVGVSVAAADTEGMDSGDSVSAISEVEGFTRTVSSAALTLTKYSGYGNQTMIGGTNNARLGSFTLSSGSTEGVNVNTITVTLSTNESGSVTDLVLKDNVTGATLATAKATPSTSNSYSVNFVVPLSSTKTIDVYGNIKSGADSGPWIAAVDGSGTGAVTATSVTFGNSSTATLQTITIGSGTLTVAVNTGSTPDTKTVIAGSTQQKVGSFRFTAQNSPFTVQEVKVKVPANAATSVSNVVLKYKNENGVEQSASQALTLSSGAQTHATATFTGLSAYIPQNTDRDIDVYVDVATIEAGASTGAAITATLDANEGFKAIDSAGTSDTSLNSSDLGSADTSGKGTLYVRKSVPTLEAVALDTTTLLAGSNVAIGRVKITANSAGDIGWQKLSFTVNKTAAITLGATTTLALYNMASNTQIAGTFGTTTGDLLGGNDSLQNSTSGNLTFVATNEEQIAAGSSITYELRTTVGGLASGSNSVSVSIANPTTSITTGTASAVGVTMAATPSFTWTDRSSSSVSGGTVHSVSTSDWTNDYLVKTLPLTVGSKSNNF